MKTQQYETLLLAHTEVTDDELVSIERSIESIANNAKGSLISFDKWGKYLLAYPVKKNSYGVYALARFSVNQDQATSAHKELDSLLRIKFNDLVLRFVTTKLDDAASAVYQKPESMDIARTANLETLNDGKIENILDSVGESDSDESISVEMSFEDEDDVSSDTTSKIA